MTDSAQTIVACASARMPAGIAVLRLSGPDAHAITARLSGQACAPHGQMVLRTLLDERGGLLDRGYVVAFHAPRTFTGQDIAELHVHGSLAVIDAVLAACCALGAQLARPGEFTQRAFEHGKLDLLAVEALADLLSARSEEARQQALAHLDGQLGQKLRQLRAPLLEILATLEGELDFGDTLGAADHTLAVQALTDLQAAIAALLAMAQAGQVRLQGARVVLYGAPNVGKSTLFNALCGVDRALVDARPGTTRDTIEVQTAPDGLLLTWVDTAGVRQTSDPVEQAGAARSLEEAAHADVVLWIDDGVAAALSGPDSGKAVVLAVRTKVDLGGPLPTGHLAVSAHSGEGVEALRAAIVLAVRGSADVGEVGLARARHAQALRSALAHVQRARRALETHLGAEYAAADLRAAAADLDELSGAIVAQDVLDDVFSRFCLGK